MKKYYDYKDRGVVIHTAHATNLTDADADFRAAHNEEPSFYGLHIRQDPEELKLLTPPAR